ncbi:asparaginase domain-containing protein [Dactylosporangium sp. AC04546]|uniref:asparaginase domain-containing protein n=1 Tax=Dactylosporangium sp. AC04546 TaxID=2862460 RepID=UPI001EDF2148|nr:asparaginase domain-containing protein [Dactylosporangium sp. AC04546]WVK80675.1 asparaginase domain-containing protein [Dactylosporangium sp. AC04546]
MTVAVLNLGGTIALSYDASGRPVTLPASELVGDQDHELFELDPVQSNALSWSHLLALRAALVRLAQSGNRTAVVITGTGTVEDVATFLHVAGPAESRVALLVSFADASGGGRAPGIDAALTWLRADHAGGLRLFADGTPFDYPFEKHCGSGAWQFLAKPRDLGVPPWRLPSSSPLAQEVPRIPVASAGIEAATWIGPLLELVPSDGLILEAYGAGDVPPPVADQVRAYVADGGHVVVTSLARPGLVEPTYPGIPGTSHGLLSAGCYGGGVLTARQARMRLAVALASGIPNAPRDAFASFMPTTSPSSPGAS